MSDYFKGCVIGLQNKEEIIDTLYQLVKKIDIEEKKERDEFFFSVLEYYDIYRKRNYFALILNGIHYNKENFIHIKNKINAKYYFVDYWDKYSGIMTKHVKEYLERKFNFNPIYKMKNKVAYIENNKKLVVNKIIKINCKCVKIYKFENLVSLSHINPGTYNLEDNCIDKIVLKSIYNNIEKIVNENWKPQPIED